MRRAENAGQRTQASFWRTRIPPDKDLRVWMTACRGLCKPARNARHGFAHLVGRARIGEANETAAVDRIEIDARGGRDVGLFQHPAGELETVGGEVRDIGIEIERAVRRQEFCQTGLRQAVNQYAAVLLASPL